jgi:hypothetical protein
MFTLEEQRALICGDLKGEKGEAEKRQEDGKRNGKQNNQ